MHVSGKFALVSGGARGIGQAISLKLLENGAAGVCLVDCDRAPLELTTEELKQKFPAAAVRCFVADLHDKDQHEQAFAYAVQQFGELHIVANNAGMLDEENPEAMAAVNLVAPYRGTLLGLQHMSRDRTGGEGGVIINTASVAGLAIIPEICFYSATKHGVVVFTRAIAASERCSDRGGVRVCCLCPNATDTDLSQKFAKNLTDRKLAEDFLNAMVRPEAVADAFLHLVGDDEANGKALVVKGPGDFVYHKFADDVASLIATITP